MRINHNISALNAWRNINQINYSMSKTLERLSSGLRINRAGDDAAGLAISEKMRGQIRGLNMAIKNAQDGISLIQTAEGALQEVHAILQRMRELAVQAANETNTAEDKEAIQAEIEQLKSEIDRIARTTEFNTKKILTGTLSYSYKVSDATVIDINSISIGRAEPGTYAFKLASTVDISSATLVTDSANWTYASDAANVTLVDIGSSETAAPVIFQINSVKVAFFASAASSVPVDSGLFDYIVESVGTALDLEEFMSGIDNIVGANESVFGFVVNESLAGGAMSAVSNLAGAALFQIASNAGSNTMGGRGILTIATNISNTTLVNNLKLAITTAYSSGGNTTKALVYGTRDFDRGDWKYDPTGAGTLGAEGNLIINGVVIHLDEADTLDTIVDKINAVSEETGVQADNVNGYLKLEQTNYGSDYSIGISGDNEVLEALGLGAGSVHGRDAQIYYNTSYDNTNLEGTLTTSGNKVVLPSDAVGVLKDAQGNVTTVEGDGLTFEFDPTNISAGVTYTIEISGEDTMTLHIGANEGQIMRIDIEDMSSEALGVDDIDVTTNAEGAITEVDSAITKVSTLRGKLGAFQNRLEHTIANLGVAAENLTAAESRIRDADMAKEMMEFTKQQILLQSSMAMLAQANVQPQNVLQLLR